MDQNKLKNLVMSQVLSDMEGGEYLEWLKEGFKETGEVGGVYVGDLVEDNEDFDKELEDRRKVEKEIEKHMEGFVKEVAKLIKLHMSK